MSMVRISEKLGPERLFCLFLMMALTACQSTTSTYVPKPTASSTSMPTPTASPTATPVATLPPNAHLQLLTGLQLDSFNTIPGNTFFVFTPDTSKLLIIDKSHFQVWSLASPVHKIIGDQQIQNTITNPQWLPDASGFVGTTLTSQPVYTNTSGVQSILGQSTSTIHIFPSPDSRALAFDAIDGISIEQVHTGAVDQQTVKTIPGSLVLLGWWGNENIVYADGQTIKGYGYKTGTTTTYGTIDDIPSYFPLGSSPDASVFTFGMAKSNYIYAISSQGLHKLVPGIFGKWYEGHEIVTVSINNYEQLLLVDPVSQHTNNLLPAFATNTSFEGISGQWLATISPASALGLTNIASGQSVSIVDALQDNPQDHPQAFEPGNNGTFYMVYHDQLYLITP